MQTNLCTSAYIRRMHQRRGEHLHNAHFSTLGLSSPSPSSPLLQWTRCESVATGHKWRITLGNMNRKRAPLFYLALRRGRMERSVVPILILHSVHHCTSILPLLLPTCRTQHHPLLRRRSLCLQRIRVNGPAESRTRNSEPEADGCTVETAAAWASWTKTAACIA